MLVGLVIGVVENKTRIRDALFKAGMTRKCSVSAWADAFDKTDESWAVVTLDDGTEVFGWPRYYSGAGDTATIYMARGDGVRGRVTIQHPGGPELPIHGPGVLIPPSARIKLITFLD